MNKKIILAIIGIGIAFLVFRTYTTHSAEAAEDALSRLGVTALAGLYLGYLAVTYILPALSEKASDFVYSDTQEVVEQDSLHDARALMAQGDYEGALVGYRAAVTKEPENRLAWTDMAKIYADKLEQPTMAIETYREAHANHEWPVEDAAFFLFRISEWQIDECEDRDACVATLEQIREAFPETRHSANAMQQLRQLGIEQS